MAVTIVFLGKLKDASGCAEMTVDGPLDWAKLHELLAPNVAEPLTDDRFHVAVNGKVLTDRTTLCAQSGDEVALLPPVSGG